MIGSTVGSYRIVSRLGIGGMGAVYRAEHTLIGRIAAVKVLHPELTSNRDVVGRFFNEAKATTTIKHPGIVEVFDFGYMPDGQAFIVMEFLDGEPLSSRMRARGRMPEGEAALMMRDVCGALAAAHAKGVVHRDLKPDNIFILPDPEQGERTKILDFGIAKLTDLGLAGSTTKTGSVMGTPTYMSPEQCRGTGTVDHRADLYSIGCMLYELVAGRPPFINDGAGELIGSHLFVEPEPPSRHVAISQELEALIMSLLSKRPEQRVQTARELAQRLLQIAQSQGWGGDVRMSGAQLSAPEHGSAAHQLPTRQVPAQHTPAPSYPASYTPAHHTPAHHTPAHHPPAHPASASRVTPAPGQPAPSFTPTPTMTTPYPAAAPGAPGKPTTLSGVASQTLGSAAGQRRHYGIMIITMVVAAAFGVAIVIATTGTSDDAPAARPATTPLDSPPPTTGAPTADPLTA
ncbi:MAG: serine/threonine protein kinase, partial [Myxococcota bacterium]|nr:serine/threonine protein kinase [Myxococcota bacterium]